MKVVVLQSNYIPWKGYFDLVNDADLFVFYDEVQYTKNDWRNRNQIYTASGLQWLTIPVNKEAVKQKISEISIVNDWQKKHYKALYLGYKSAPFFFQLEALMEEYLIQKKWDSLKELNHYLIQKIAGLIGITTQFKDSAEFNLNGNRVERLVNLLVQVGATHYISGPSGINYIKDAAPLFDAHQIELSYKSYPQYMPYPQWKLPFQTSVSILDLIAHLDYADIKNYIWQNKLSKP